MSNEYVANSLMNGYMVKRGSFIKNWKRRFFVLTNRYELMYFAQKGDETPIKCLILAPTFDFQSSEKKDNAFLIRPKNAKGKVMRNFYCYTETKEDFAEWWRCFTEVKAKLAKKMKAARSGATASTDERRTISEANALRRMMREIFSGGSDVLIAQAKLLQIQLLYLHGVEKTSIDASLIQYMTQYREMRADSDFYEHACKIQINTGSSITPSLATVLVRRTDLRSQFSTSGNVKRSERILYNFRKKHLPKEFDDVDPESAPLDDNIFILYDLCLLSCVAAVQDNDLGEVELQLRSSEALLQRGEEHLQQLKAKRKINSRVLEDLLQLNALDRVRILYMHGWLAAQNKNGEQCIAKYKEALKLAKSFKLDLITRSLLVTISEEYFQLGEYEKSKSCYTKVNRLDASTCFALVPDGSTIFTIYNNKVSKRIAGAVY